MVCVQLLSCCCLEMSLNTPLHCTSPWHEPYEVSSLEVSGPHVPVHDFAERSKSEKYAPAPHSSLAPCVQDLSDPLHREDKAHMAPSSLTSYQHMHLLNTCCAMICVHLADEVGTACHSAAASEATGPGQTLLQATITSRTDQAQKKQGLFFI